jgi:nucleoid-associated protein YgaU
MTPDDKSRADFSDVKSGASSTSPKSAAGERTYTVVQGDSLSKIAQRFYGKADEWRTIYEANREVIGNNPDLIKPGQIFVIPEA